MIYILGIIATVIILISMSFPTTHKGVIWMRITNILGSLLMVIYGILQQEIDYPIIILNSILTGVNTYHLIVLLKRQHNKLKKVD